MSRERVEKLRAVITRRQPDLTVVMENVHKPHNFSAVVRTCDAVGILDAHAVVPPGHVAPNAAVAQSAQKWVRVRTHAAVADAVAAVRQSGHKVVAAHLSERAVDFRAFDYTQPTALLLGQELGGVTEEALALVDAEVVIPMAGLVASLNVSVAAAVILYEAQRQREAKGLYAKPRLSDVEAQRLLFEYLHPDMAEHYAKRGEPYPAFDDDGHIVFKK
ncbi:MAG: tRNA (guanosine(18)-2'-O)-methyltransferase TrmH [Myxococcota bacterium]|nr:tRNA (guanosine(18)-2'-O)-methyltransferase TrmH [Myxococcota bacterium]